MCLCLNALICFFVVLVNWFPNSRVNKAYGGEKALASSASLTQRPRYTILSNLAHPYTIQTLCGKVYQYVYSFIPFTLEQFSTICISCCPWLYCFQKESGNIPLASILSSSFFFFFYYVSTFRSRLFFTDFPRAASVTMKKKIPICKDTVEDAVYLKLLCVVVESGSKRNSSCTCITEWRFACTK